MNSQKKTIVYGFGITGQSIVSYLIKKNHKLLVIDNKKFSEDQKSLFKKNNIEYSENENEITDFSIIEQCFVSPGVDLRKSFIQKCIKSNTPVRNDTFFLNQIDRKKTKIIGITGTNGKTTFCSLLTSILSFNDLKSIAVGNIGVPILNLLMTPNEFDYIVVELSSYQIEVLDKETIFDYGVILNIEPDHLDRYNSFIDYKNAKLKLANHSKTILYDKKSAIVNEHSKAISIDLKDFHIEEINTNFFIFKNQNKTFRIDTPYLKGIHNVKNILYLLKLLEIMNCNIPFEKIRRFFKNQKGIPHRFEYISINKNYIFINDSKATNLASSISALNSVNGKIHLLFGGDLKNQSLDGIENFFNEKLISLNLFGKDAMIIKDYLKNKKIKFDMKCFVSLEAILVSIKQMIKKDEIILLSPGCASQDMFMNYQDRGNQFVELCKKIF